MNWQPVIAYRSLIEVECRRWCGGSDIVHDEMIMLSQDYIARYWPARIETTEHTVVRQLCRWACQHVWKRRRDERRLFVELKHAQKTVPDTPTAFPTLALVSVCSAIEKLSGSDRIVFHEHFECGLSWTDAMRAAGLSSVRSVTRHRDRFLRRFRRTMASLVMLSSLPVIASDLGPPPEPAYLSNARVKATWTWAQDAWVVMQQQADRIAELEQQLAEKPVEVPEPVATVTFPSSVLMRWELLEWGRESLYRVHFSEPLGVLDPQPLPAEPVIISSQDFVAWGSFPGSNWTGAGAPMPSGDGLGWFAPANWLEYDVPAGSWSKVAVAMAVPEGGGELALTVGDRTVTLPVPGTGAWSTFADLVFDFPLLGPARLRVTGAKGGTGYWVGDIKEVRLLP